MRRSDEDGVPISRERLERLLLEGLTSGPSTPMTPDDWAEIRRETKARLEAFLLEGLESGEPIEVTAEFWAQKRNRLVGPPSEA